MTDLHALFAVLCGLYLVECLTWVRAGETAFRSLLGTSFGAHDGGDLVGNGRGGFLVLFPLPPLGRVFLAEAAPAGQALALWGAGGRARFDAARARQRLADVNRSTRLLRATGNGYWLLLFAVVPAVVARRGLSASWPGLLAALALASAATVLLYLQARRALRRAGVAAAAPLSPLVGLALFPPAAVRAADHVTRRAFADFDALAVARVVLDEPSAVALARRALFPCLAEAASSGLLRALELEPTQMRAAPERIQEDARGYCPRCHAAFRISVGDCTDCHGVAILPFPSRTNAGRPIPADSPLRL